MHAAQSTSPPLITGELARHGMVLVRADAAQSRSLHSWVGGSFGELLSIDAASDDAHPVMIVDRLEAKERQTKMMLRLRAVEAYYLAYGLPEPRLQVIWSPHAAAAAAAAAANGSDDDAAASAAAAAAAAATDGGRGTTTPLSATELWEALEAGEPLFPYLYCAYTALRDAGWKIRDGVKFGFDFALYDATGGANKHAPLGAIVLAPQADAERSWLWLQRHARVCHSVGKGLLLCSVEPAGEGGALELSTIRIDGWDPGRAHAHLSDSRPSGKAAKS